MLLDALPSAGLLLFGRLCKDPDRAIHLIALGIALTLLDSFECRLGLGRTEYFVEFPLIRVTFPYLETSIKKYPMAAFAILFAVLLAVLPIVAKLVDYGVEGWLWAIFGLYHRQYVDARSSSESGGEDHGAVGVSRMEIFLRPLACVAAAVIYVWQEQKEFSFPQPHFTVVIIGVALLSLGLYLFKRGPSRFQPPAAIAGAMSFVGRHTLEIYAIQLAVSEIIIKLLPDLAA